MIIIKRKTIIMTMLTILVLCFSQATFATSLSDASFFTVPAGDLSIKVLQQIFGELFGGGNDPMLDSILLFNLSILFVGGILAGYTIILGVIGTAHDGQMLGKELSSAWLPIRYSIGTLLITPISGYCIAQYAVAWLIMMGIGLADTVWIGFTAKPMEVANTTMLISSKDNVLKMAENLYQTEYCLLVAENGLKQRWFKRSISEGDIGWRTETITKTGNGTSGTVSVAGINTTLFDATCGTIRPLVSNDVAVGNAPSSTGNIGTENYGRLGDLSAIMGSPINVSSIMNYQNQAANTLRQKMKSLAQSTYGMNNEDYEKNRLKIYNQLISSTNEYINDIQNKSTAFTHSYSVDGTIPGLIAAKDGWFLAGTYFMKHAFMSETINRSVNTVPETGYKGNLVLEWSDLGNLAYRASAIVAYAKSSDGLGINVFYGSPEEKKKIQSDALGTSFGSQLAGRISMIMSGVDIATLKNDPRHPIIIMSEMGSRLINSTQSFMAWTVGGLALTGITFMGTGVNLGPVVNAIFAILNLPFAVLWTTAFVMTNLIPMMPFIIWFGAIIGWCILVVEAIIAAPLWCVMHLHPKGADLVGAASKGYTLVLALLLRPVLLIFGFIAALILTEVFGELLNKVFYQVWASSLNGAPSTGLASFVQPLFGTVIYAAVQLTLITKMFSISTLIADQLLKWIGGPQEQLGQFADAFAQRGNQSFMGAAAFTNQAVGQGLNSAGKGAAGIAHAIQDMRDKGKNEKAQRAGNLAHAQHEMSQKGEAYEMMTKKDGGKADGHLNELNDSISDLGGNNTDQAQQMVSAYNANREAGQAHRPALKSAVDQTLGEGSYSRIYEAKRVANLEGKSVTKAGKGVVADINKEKEDKANEEKMMRL